VRPRAAISCSTVLCNGELSVEGVKLFQLAIFSGQTGAAPATAAGLAIDAMGFFAARAAIQCRRRRIALFSYLPSGVVLLRRLIGC